MLCRRDILGRLSKIAASVGVCGAMLAAGSAYAQNPESQTPESQSAASAQNAEVQPRVSVQAPGARYADDASVISVGEKLRYRPAMFPYPTQEEAVAQADNSSYVIALTNWERGTATAATTFTTQFKYRYAWNNRSVIFRIEDATSSFSLYVNGREAGYSQNGAGRSEFDITGFVQEDYNTLEVVIYDGAAARRLEAGRQQSAQAPHFRTAAVITQPTVRIDDIFTEVSFEERVAYLSIDVVMQSVLLNPKEYLVQYELFDPSGRSVARAQKAVNTGVRSRDAVHFVAEIPEPRRWTHETPDLYTLVVGSRYEGRAMEFLTFRTGLCDAHLEAEQLFIGSEPVILRGVRSAAGENRAVTLDKLQRLKNEGYNCIVVDGAPQPDYLYSLCDSIGMYVCDAANINTGRAASMRAAENPSNNPLWRAACLDRTQAMYYASHTHPSVVIYSPATNSGNGYCIYESCMLLKELSDKPIYYADAAGYWNNDIADGTLFNKPSAHRSQGGAQVEMRREAGEVLLTIRNAGDLKSIDGTCKITLKSGRKEVDKTMGELNLKAGESQEVRYALPAALPPKASLTVEISCKKSNAPQSGGKLSDLYDTTAYNFKL